MTKCSICKESKENKFFVKRNNRVSGIQPYCKDCHNKKSRKKYNSIAMRNYDLKKSYGIDLEYYECLLKKQNNRCKICKIHISEMKSNTKANFCVDHCHKTKIIRGLLCDSCNRGIGLLKDDYNVLLSAYNYLKETQEIKN
jgi:hypothetical protein